MACLFLHGNSIASHGDGVGGGWGMSEKEINIDVRHSMLFGLCKCGLVRRPVKSDKQGYNKIQCAAGHVKYIHEDY